MKTQLLVSIITVCRNSASTIERTFESVLRQSYSPLEYIVVDGASHDGTIDILGKYESVFLKEGISFRWLSEPDFGIYDAMNKGLDRAQGEIVGILNSDDYYEPGALQAVASAADSNPDVGIFYGFLRVHWGGEEILTYRYRYERYLLNRQSGIYSATQHPTCFVRTRVYDLLGQFDTRFSIAADHDFLIRASLAGVKFHALDTVISNFTSGGASDQMSDFTRHKERYEVWQKNGLLSAEEYANARSLVRYKRVKELRQRLVKRIFRL